MILYYLKLPIKILMTKNPMNVIDDTHTHYKIYQFAYN